MSDDDVTTRKVGAGGTATDSERRECVCIQYFKLAIRNFHDRRIAARHAASALFLYPRSELGETVDGDVTLSNQSARFRIGDLPSDEQGMRFGGAACMLMAVAFDDVDVFSRDDDCARLVPSLALSRCDHSSRGSQMNSSQIPELTAKTPAAARYWFKTMHARGLMFHPDDDPKDVIHISDGTRSFSDLECVQLAGYLGQLFAALGDAVYEIAFEVVSETFHTLAERQAIAEACA